MTTHGIADRNTPRVTNTLILEVRDTKRNVNLTGLSRAVAAGNVKGIEDALLLTDLDAGLKAKYGKQIGEVLNEAGIANVKRQPKVLAATFGRFDLTNPRAAEWARQKSSTLVREITEGSKLTIRRIVADGIENGVPVRTTARRLRSSIGLTQRQWTSVSNFRERAIDAGMSLPRAEKVADRFAQKVHRRRAELIARTETIDASIQGRTELWDQAADRGLIEQDKVQRMWIVTPDDRLDSLICLPMAGQKRGLKEQFLTGDNRLVNGPTAHPGCRCDVILVIPGTSVFGQDPDERSASQRRQAGTVFTPEGKVVPRRLPPGLNLLTPGGKPAVTTPGAAGSQVPAGTTASTTITPPTPKPPTRRALRARPGEEPLTLPTGPPRPAPGPAAVTPEEVFTRHPNLETMRGNLIVEDFTDFRVREVVDDLALLSDNVLKKMADKGVEYRVTATKTIPEMLGSPGLAKKRPPGWKRGTWKDVRGGYFSRGDEAKVLINVNKTGGSASVGLHEYGHAIGDKLGLNLAPELRAANIRNLDNLPSYFTQGGRRGTRGRREMLAESTAMWHKPIGNLTGKQRVAAFVDEDFANWLDKQLR